MFKTKTILVMTVERREALSLGHVPFDGVADWRFNYSNTTPLKELNIYTFLGHGILKFLNIETCSGTDGIYLIGTRVFSTAVNLNLLFT